MYIKIFHQFIHVSKNFGEIEKKKILAAKLPANNTVVLLLDKASYINVNILAAVRIQTYTSTAGTIIYKLSLVRPQAISQVFDRISHTHSHTLSL